METEAIPFIIYQLLRNTILIAILPSGLSATMSNPCLFLIISAAHTTVPHVSTDLLFQPLNYKEKMKKRMETLSHDLEIIKCTPIELVISLSVMYQAILAKAAIMFPLSKRLAVG
jgi:hypothetical protein